jgi:hypothetical protein
MLVENWFALLERVIDDSKSMNLDPRNINSGMLGSFVLSSLELATFLPRSPFHLFTERETSVPCLWITIDHSTGAFLDTTSTKLPSSEGLQRGVYLITEPLVRREDRLTDIPLECFTLLRMLLSSSESVIGCPLDLTMNLMIRFRVNEQLTQVELPRMPDLVATVLGEEFRGAQILSLGAKRDGPPSYAIEATKSTVTERVEGAHLEGHASDIAQGIQGDLQERSRNLKFNFLRLK